MLTTACRFKDADADVLLLLPAEDYARAAPMRRIRCACSMFHADTREENEPRLRQRSVAAAVTLRRRRSDAAGCLLRCCLLTLSPLPSILYEALMPLPLRHADVYAPAYFSLRRLLLSRCC